MLIRILVFVCEMSPWAKRLIWRCWYQRLARRISSDSWTFMNYGWAQSSGDPALQLRSEDEADRSCIQLYHHVVGDADLKGKRVVEVGSGRGGGASFVARYHNPTEMVGVDFSAEAVAFSRKRHGVSNLNFEVGDAESLSFPDESFDIVLNVESSHCYGDIKKFVSEATRILRPGGQFLIADFRDSEGVKLLERCFDAQPDLEVVGREEITSEVLAALGADDDRKRQQINELVPTQLRGMFEEFAGLSGSRIFEGFKTGGMVYYRFALRKRG
jgi:ubiquinone/menaquinone biosynthesis C-methylase UbiE